MMQREDILQALGRIPQRAETPARRSLAESRDGISRYLVRYETEPGEQVTAWLLVPEGGRAVSYTHLKSMDVYSRRFRSKTAFL